MQTLSAQLESSRDRLGAEGQRFLQQTRAAARSFVHQTLDAGQGFYAETRQAADALRGEATDAGQGIARAAREEGREWLERLSAGRGEALAGLELARIPAGLERKALAQLMVGLDGLEARVEARLRRLEEHARLSADAGVEREPFKGYDGLNAKQVVSRLGKLGAAKRDAVVRYEEAHKRRATVLKAAQRLTH